MNNIHQTSTHRIVTDIFLEVLVTRLKPSSKDEAERRSVNFNWKCMRYVWFRIRQTHTHTQILSNEMYNTEWYEESSE